MKKSTFCIVLISAFSAMLGLGIISPFLPEFAKQHGANGFWIGMIFSGFAISRVIIMPIVGKISDRTGRKVFVVSGLFLYTVISLFYPAADNVYTLTIVRMVHGLAAGMIIPILMAYVGDIAEKGKEGVRTGTLNMMAYLGVAAGPFLAGYINQSYGFDAVFHVMSLLGGITFLIVLFFLPDTKPSVPIDSKKNMPFHLNSLLRHNFIKAVFISVVVIMLMLSVFMSFLPSLATRIKVDIDHIGIILSVGILMAGLLQVPSGKLADRLDWIGKFIQIGSGTSVAMLALLAMPFCPDFKVLLVAGILLGTGTGITVPALTSISVSIGQTVGMGLWMGIFYTVIGITFAVTPLIAGMIMDHLGIDAVFYILGLMAFFGILAYAHYFRRRLLGHKIG